jgi:hypothetical protein
VSPLIADADVAIAASIGVIVNHGTITMINSALLTVILIIIRWRCQHIRAELAANGRRVVAD